MPLSWGPKASTSSPSEHFRQSNYLLAVVLPQDSPGPFLVPQESHMAVRSMDNTMVKAMVGAPPSCCMARHTPLGLGVIIPPNGIAAGLPWVLWGPDVFPSIKHLKHSEHSARASSCARVERNEFVGQLCLLKNTLVLWLTLFVMHMYYFFYS